MLTRLMAYLRGYLALVAWGNIERFINLAVERGIRLWEIRRLNGRASLRVGLPDVYALRHVARRARSRFRIVERRGLPFLLGRLRRRWMLVAGGCFFLLALYFLSTFVWSVEVRSQGELREIEPARVVAAAGEEGLRPGVQKRRVDRSSLEAALADRFPRLAWVNIRYEGTRAVIEVVERVLPAPASDAPADLVAGKDGLVREILVLAGEARVREGETVRRGQVLISGRFTPPPVPPGAVTPPLPPPRPVRARGIVRASVWYEASGTAALAEETERPTGRRASSFSFLWGGREIKVRGPGKPPYQHFRQERREAPLPLLGEAVPARLVTTTYYEVEVRRAFRSPAEARAAAERRAREALAGLLPPGAHLLDITVEELPPAGGQVRVRVLAETLEDIAALRPLAQGSGPPAAHLAQP